MTIKRLMILAAISAAVACIADSDGGDKASDDSDDGDQTSPDAGKADAATADASKADGATADASKADAGGGACDGLTYAAFGKTFEATYCASCHAASKKDDARRGAPDDYVFDTLAQIQEHKDEIKTQVKVKAMPFPFPDVKQPTDPEREKLQAWIDCGPN